jgi:N-methylhydantoinase A
MRYVGQNFEIAVAVESDERNGAWCEKFHALHKKLYGYDQPSKKIELVTFCLQARQPRDAATAVAPPPMQRTGKLAPREQRTVYFEATGFSDCPVFARGDMIAGDRLSGPAVIEQMDTTTILPPGCHLQVDTGLRLHLSWRPK